MSRLRLSDLAPETANRVVAAAREQGIDLNYRAKQPRTRRIIDPAWWTGDEGGLQKAVNAVLRSMGYWPRDKRSILATRGDSAAMIQRERRGWYLHVSRSIGNPYVLDLLILDGRGRYLEIELKTATGDLSEIQEALVAADNLRVCRSVDEARGAVEEWEQNVEVDRDK